MALQLESQEKKAGMRTSSFLSQSDYTSGTADAAVLRLEKLNKSFEDLHVLKDFDLEIKRGEVVTLLGPSGCGKTTTLNVVAGLLKPDSGKIILRGKVVNHLPPQKRKVGMVFQRWALFPHMTVRENIAFGLRLKKLRKTEIEKRVDEMLQLVKLPSIPHKFPSQLSGGMQQRVATARTLAVDPDVLNLDEPIINFDEKVRREMEVEMRTIQEFLEVTTLFVTHNQEEALIMSDRVAVMYEGKIIQIDTPQKIYDEPATCFVLQFLGESNMFEAKVLEASKSTVLLTSGEIVFTAVARGVLEAGTKVKVAIRPERLQIVRGGPSLIDDCPNCFSGKIVCTVYKGSSVTYVVDISGQEFQAVENCVDPARVLEKGDEVRVGISVAAINIVEVE